LQHRLALQRVRRTVFARQRRQLDDSHLLDQVG
jgi:hypothetical protein